MQELTSHFTLDRRQALGLGAGGLAFVSLGLPAMAGIELPFRAIYDQRFDAALQFAAEAAAKGWNTRAITGDVTKIWYNELAPRWKQGPAPITGVTTPDALFVLERLAWDAKMRVTHRSTIGTHLVAWRISTPGAPLA